MAAEQSKIWIRKGYETFALKGANCLKIEALAKDVNISKSSFYHYFADMEIFISELLNEHLIRAKNIAAEEEKCKNIEPELINVLVNAKIDLLFSKQLRFHRQIPEYAECLKESSKYIGTSFLKVWTNYMGLAERNQLALDFFELAIENFYIQLNEETINTEWLSNYFRELKYFAASFKR